MNDAKIMPISMQHLKKIIPRPDITLRSHSSANSRCCKRDLSGLKRIDIIDKSKVEYSKEFFDACCASNAKIAIPFASNMIHLHKETEKYNSICNFSDYVEKDFLNLKNNYPNIDCKMILPGESINLNSFKIKIDETLRYEIKNKDRDVLINEIKSSINDKLNKQINNERKAKPKDAIIIAYFLNIIKESPSFLSWYLSNHIHIESYGESKKNIYRLNFKKKLVEKIHSPQFSRSTLIIRVQNYVLNDVCRMKNYNSLGISKRLEIRSLPGNFRYEIFNILCNSIESGGPFPLKNIFSFSFIIRWLRRFRELIDIFLFLISKFYNKKYFKL